MDDKLHGELVSNPKEGLRFAKGKESKSTVYAVLSAAGIKTIRVSAIVSQAAFARTFQLSLETLKGWEQSKRKPDTAAAYYLRLVKAYPQNVQRTLAA